VSWQSRNNRQDPWPHPAQSRHSLNSGVCLNLRLR
jgi:hypothetical protein